MPRSILAVAAVARSVAMVLFVNGRLTNWLVSEQAAKSPKHAAAMMQKWIDEFEPEVVVTEKLETIRFKKAHAKSLIAAMAEQAAKNPVLDVAVERERKCDNKYDEAAALVESYPDLGPWLPKRRRVQDNEARNIILFEAVVLAETVLRGKGPGLAAALG